jgi:uncharacterized OsmC-like protein
MTNAPPKSWSVKVLSVADQPLAITCAEQVSPVEYLLISIASCFALSCRMALRHRELTADSLEVLVQGTKAQEGPSRLETIDIELVLPDELAAQADAIAVDSKQLCTVTNTLAAGPQARLWVRARA